MSLSMSPLWLSVDYCDINVTITTQGDIESLHATPYEFCFNNVTITNAEGTLTFDNFTQVNGLYVQDSPNLEALSFPDLGRLSALGVYDALALSNISLPEIQSVGLLPFGGGGWSVPPPWPGAEDRSLIGVTINNAPALKTIDFDFLSGFFTLELVGADGLTDFGPTGYDEGILRRINSSDTLSVDGCFNLANVQFARFVQITGRTDCEYLMLNYHSAYNLTLIDTAHSRLDILAPFAVNGTLVADSLQLSPENSSSYDPQPLYFISSIGEDAHLLSSANVDLSLDEVETLGGSLVASNNKNCTFSFDKLSEVKGNISMTDNPD